MPAALPRRFAAALLTASALTICAGCGASGPPSGLQTGAATGPRSGGSGGPLIGESSPVASNPNQQAVTYGQRQAAEQLGFRFRTLDANLSPDRQVSDLDTLLNFKPAGITTWTLDPGAADAVYQRIAEAGIPLVGLNSESPSIATDVYDTATSGAACTPFKDAAAYVAQRAPHARVLVIGGPPVPAPEHRVACFERAARSAGLQVVGEQDNVKDTAATAQPIVQDMLTKHPDAEAIWAYNDPSALGAAAVLQSQGKPVWSGATKGVIVIGNNGTTDAIDAIKAGQMTVTYDANSAQVGAMGVWAIALHVKKGVPIDQLPKKIKVQATRYDSTNADRFVPPLERTIKLPPLK